MTRGPSPAPRLNLIAAHAKRREVLLAQGHATVDQSVQTTAIPHAGCMPIASRFVTAA